MDVATNFEEHWAGLGIAIRDANKNLVAAAIKITKFYSNVAFAKAKAMNWRLEVASSSSLSSIIVESDFQDIIYFVNSRKSSRTEIQWEIPGMQSKMKGFNAIKSNIL